MGTLSWILAATIVNSLVALAGAATLAWSKGTLEKALHALVGFSAGTLLAGAFFHLIAESLEEMQAMDAFYLVFAGFILFFLIERFLHWHHCHEGHCDVHAFSYLILFGDAIHNFIDGIIIAASFLVNAALGIATAIAVISHELPQELGDFGVLVYGGFERKKALLYNLISQMTSILGGIIGFFFIGATGIEAYLLPFAAGGFIYISASDLIPELHKEASIRKSLVAFMFFLLGVGFMLAVKQFFAN
ncbi:MAG: ZIP family metal transporter [Candidatus Diapherotrites archaeon]|uniref:ZIP family metal transporter n=1 Tax=Candidatus Iainarchaeum sp. TaxID=3101447 RepID=A0A938YQI5_9ARCH|nr:ZIP family metal transporter [Candidatus Diapherotrites archaeon]